MMMNSVKRLLALHDDVIEDSLHDGIAIFSSLVLSELKPNVCCQRVMSFMHAFIHSFIH